VAGWLTLASEWEARGAKAATTARNL